MKRSLLTLVLTGLAAGAVQAQELKINAVLITWYHQSLDSSLRKNPVAPGSYYAFGGSGDAMRENGFSIRRTEIYLNGKINDQFSAAVVFDPKENSPIILDAAITWKPNAQVELKAGQFKPLQSYEATSIGSPDLLFVDRGQFARRFGDIRDRGVTAAYTFGDKDMSLKVTAGVFNGANRANDANAQKDFVLRADFSAGSHKAGLFTLQGVTDVKDTTGLDIVPGQGAIDTAWGLGADYLYYTHEEPRGLYLTLGLGYQWWTVDPKEGPSASENGLSFAGGAGWRFNRTFALEGRFTTAQFRSNEGQGSAFQVLATLRF